MTTYSEQGCPFKDGGCSYLDHNHPMTTSTIKENVDDLLCRFATGYTRKELITFGEEDTGLDDMEVIDQLKEVDKFTDAILQLFDEAEKRGREAGFFGARVACKECNNCETNRLTLKYLDNGDDKQGGSEG